MNYYKLISCNPTKLGEMTNSIGQLIEFYEHPIQGDEHPIIAACKEVEQAANTNFFDLADMLADHLEYEPKFVDGHFYIGSFR